MTGIILAGLGIGGLIGPPVISRLLVTYGWFMSCIVLGIAVLFLVIVATQFLRRDPS